MDQPVQHRFRQHIVLPLVGAAILGAANVPPLWTTVTDWAHQREINSTEYKRERGRWQTIELPESQRVNAIHSAVLPTGKILLIAGSGNRTDQFEAGTFRTVVFDPGSGRTTQVPTPTDLFCAGHTFLPDGKLLVAGGTLRYEVLAGAVDRAGGTMTVKNESPNATARTFPKGTVFVDQEDGRRFTSGDEFTVAPATKVVTPMTKKNEVAQVTVTASETQVWVDAAEKGSAQASTGLRKYRIEGLSAAESADLYGMTQKVTMDKQDYQGRKETYEFNPLTERYERVADMHEKRWYPTLLGLADGKVLAVSGLDGSGQVVSGNQNEVYDPVTKQWTVRRDLDRYFPTYPSLFQTDRPGRLFYSGSNSGYGPADKGREPGFWNLGDNSFEAVPGLRDADQLETSMSSWVGPVQNQTVMVVGGGGVGESRKSSRRIDLIKLNDATPTFRPGPDLPEGTRYPNLVTLPDDTTLITNGARDYRGRGATDNHTALLYDAGTDTLKRAADPRVGRNYHSSAVLLPDGRVLTVGSDPLFKDKKNTISGSFEQRIELYTPPYLFRGARPIVGDGTAEVKRGGTATFTTGDADKIVKARLVRPSSATHMLNVDQRSLALDVATTADSVTVTVPAAPALVPEGPWMLFLVSADGVPSVARWVTVRG